MSAVIPGVEIEYPESDGQPMGETDWHIKATNRLSDMLRFRYRGERVYVGSNLLLYYVEGVPRRFVVPDVFVVFDCDPKDRRVFKVWEEGHAPDIVFEITSSATAREDQVFKPKIYEEIGVKELFLFDPTGDYLVPPLQGFRLMNRTQVPLEPQNDQFHSEVLGLNIAVHDKRLQLIDSTIGKEILTGEESERQARIASEMEIERLKAELEQLRRERG